MNYRNCSKRTTVKRTRKEVLESLKLRKEDLYSSTVLKHDNIILKEYQRKKDKIVLLLSSLHPTLEVEFIEEKALEAIKFYNSTKYGVDVLDKMATKYSTKSACRRWPEQVFFNILDLAVINVWIIYKEIIGMKIKS
ncbi:hypothetical protein AVEN_133370-1 [Araneus ventricosus]|uniref:PiggyBac transposable element-derived protein domain-containing protein n=1 Tax=Araneus ventricosus TaxID=182803 RepID=A0A4Y2KAS3_ARAVE|nr:hypothetical protein AVEN_133370-1 [Araneus ventricosus]